MIYPYRADESQNITDNTQELKSTDILLATKQNARYRQELDSKIKTISPHELIESWNLQDMKIIGVTGTNGKTTTTAIIYSLLIDLGYGCALQGTRGLFINDQAVENRRMTTPSILEILWNIKQAKEAGAEFFVMEVSSHAIDQERIEGLRFALKVHTNVSSDHLDYHGTIEEYRRIKSLFFADDSLKLLNKDEIKSIRYNPKNVFTYGVEEPASFKVMAYSLQEGISAVVRFKDEQEPFFSNMVGLFNLYNLLAAVASVKLLTQRPLAQICDAIENFGGVSGRMELVSAKPLVIVDFAHTDDGMYKVLDSLKDKEIALVFGAGGDRDRSKRPRMGAVAGRFAKKIYITSDNPRSEDPKVIANEILQGLRGKEGVQVILDRYEAIKRAIDELEESEILLILGKGDESTQEINGIKYPFDDRETVRQILAAKEG